MNDEICGMAAGQKIKFVNCLQIQNQFRMKILVLSLCLLTLSISSVFGTDPRPEKCGTMSHMEYLKAKNPGLAQQMILDEQVVQQALANSALMRNSNVVYTIPVVVHVVYKTTGQNISDAQVQSQIDVLNEDFGRLNADTVNTPTQFQGIAAPTNFQFCLARRDPNGLPTNGIERRQTTVNSFSQNDDVKHYATGGLDAWDVNKYLNIWVCNLTGGLLGYGEFPSTVHTNTFGVVVIFNSFGRTGLVTPPYNLGRTCTHEFSHCFRLYHIWGDDGGSCTGSDLCNDTPNQGDATYGCYNFPRIDNCATTSPGIMYMNYMDYSDDDCLNMFTGNQASRMFASINAFYNSLFTSDGCEEVISAVNTPLDFQFSVYPNPSEGLINLDMFTSRNIGESANVLITDAVGRVVRETSISNPNGQVHSIDLSGEANGMYFMTVYNNEYRKTVSFHLSK
jgi:hypothetical protein